MLTEQQSKQLKYALYLLIGCVVAFGLFGSVFSQHSDSSLVPKEIFYRKVTADAPVDLCVSHKLLSINGCMSFTRQQCLQSVDAAAKHCMSINDKDLPEFFPGFASSEAQHWHHTLINCSARVLITQLRQTANPTAAACLRRLPNLQFES